MKKTADKRRVVQAIRLVFASLESHLDYSSEQVPQMCESCGTRKFHAEAVKEYAFILHVLSDHL